MCPGDNADPGTKVGERPMKRNRSLAIDDAKTVTQSFFDILDVILTSIHESVVVLNADLKVVRANNAFYRTFHLNADEVEGVNIYDFGNRQWDIPGLRELLENILLKIQNMMTSRRIMILEPWAIRYSI